MTTTDQNLIRFHEIPLRALQKSTRVQLSLMLNQETVIPTADHYLRDWQGIAELSGCSHGEIEAFRKFSNPTEKLLMHWEKESNSTIGHLIDTLNKLERYDVLDEVQNKLDRDATTFLEKRKVSADGSLDISGSSKDKASTISTEPLKGKLLTIDDVKSASDNKRFQQYDGYVCYANEDINFVYELVDHLESEFRLKLCYKDRDELAGGLELQTAIQLIEKRCNRMIIILSPEFLKSPVLEYLTMFSQAISLEEQKHRLVPIIFKKCELPYYLKYLSKLEYKPEVNKFNYFWQRLHAAVYEPNRQQVSQGNDIEPFNAVNSGSCQKSTPVSSNTSSEYAARSSTSTFMNREDGSMYSKESLSSDQSYNTTIDKSISTGDSGIDDADQFQEVDHRTLDLMEADRHSAVGGARPYSMSKTQKIFAFFAKKPNSPKKEK